MKFSKKGEDEKGWK